MSIPQAAKVVLERLVVWIFDARFDDRDNSSRPDEPCQVVDVAMRVVAFDSPSEPNDMADTEIVGEDSLDRCTIEVGVAGLDLAEQAFFGRKQSPPSIDVDRPPSITILRR